MVSERLYTWILTINSELIFKLSSTDDPEFAQWVPPLIARLIPILLHPKVQRSLHENAAVSIGRIGLMHPSIVAPHLPEFAQAWCQALHDIRDNEEKDSAFRGLCQLVQTNPSGIWKVRLLQPAILVPYQRLTLHNRVFSGSAMQSCDGKRLLRVSIMHSKKSYVG